MSLSFTGIEIVMLCVDFVWNALKTDKNNWMNQIGNAHRHRGKTKRMRLFDCAKVVMFGAAATTNNNKLKAKIVCVFHLLRRAHTSRYIDVLIVVRMPLLPCSKENRTKKKIETQSNAHKCTHTHTRRRAYLCVCVCVREYIRAAPLCVRVYGNTYYVSHLHARPYSIQHIIIKIYRHTHTAVAPSNKLLTISNTHTQTYTHACMRDTIQWHTHTMILATRNQFPF